LSRSKFDDPVQPKLGVFPKTKGRRFNSDYYKSFPWIEYSKASNQAFCYTCRHFVPSSSSRKGEKLGLRPFIEAGFSRWKDAAENFRKHENSERHTIALTLQLNFKLIQQNKMTPISNVLQSVTEK
jgi:hypothetical protein